MPFREILREPHDQNRRLLQQNLPGADISDGAAMLIEINR
jgi:hypothetical protein